MKVCLRPLHTAALAMMLMLGAACFASSEDKLVEGRDFLRVPANDTRAARLSASTRAVEVLEFFSYGCGACDKFRPLSSRWGAALPRNTTFSRIPTALGRREWKPLVRMYYALQSTGNLERLDQALFDAIHRENQRLFSEAALIAWAERQGVDADTFRTAFYSRAVSERVSWSEQMDKAYAVPSTPTLVIDGKYLVRGVSTLEEQLRVASQLVNQALATRKGPDTAPDTPNENMRRGSEVP